MGNNILDIATVGTKYKLEGFVSGYIRAHKELDTYLPEDSWVSVTVDENIIDINIFEGEHIDGTEKILAAAYLVRDDKTITTNWIPLDILT
jgi:hypothetical protein